MSAARGLTLNRIHQFAVASTLKALYKSQGERRNVQILVKFSVDTMAAPLFVASIQAAMPPHSRSKSVWFPHASLTSGHGRNLPLMFLLPKSLRHQ